MDPRDVQEQRSSVQAYLRGLRWDGVHRIAHIFGADASAPTREAAAAFFRRAARRALDPGCEPGPSLLLATPQGVGKTRLLRALAGSHYGELCGLEGRTVVACLARKWIVEVPLGLLLEGSLEEAKSLLTSTADRVGAARTPRANVFVVTTNDAEVEVSGALARRLVPVVLAGDVPDPADRDQLWAEAVAALVERRE